MADDLHPQGLCGCGADGSAAASHFRKAVLILIQDRGCRDFMRPNLSNPLPVTCTISSYSVRISNVWERTTENVDYRQDVLDQATKDGRIAPEVDDLFLFLVRLINYLQDFVLNLPDNMDFVAQLLLWYTVQRSGCGYDLLDGPGIPTTTKKWASKPENRNEASSN